MKQKKNFMNVKANHIRKHRDICVNRCVAGRTDKQYYKDNAVTIREKRNTKLDCVCGGRYTRTNKARHEKTKFHIKYVSEN